MNITIRQLEIFVELIRTGNLTKAAKVLNMTQAAASLALKELETQLGEKLFDRVGKRLILNEFGRSVKELAFEIIEKAESLEKSFSSDIDAEFNIGASTTIGNYIIPDVITNFLKMNENIKINLFVGNSEEVIKKIADFEVDCGFIEGFCNSKNILTYEFMDDELVVFVGVSHPLAKKKRLDLDDLKKVEWVLREKGSGTRDVFECAMNRVNLPVNILMELGNSEAIKIFVANGVGVGCLSKRVVSDFVELNKVKILNTPFLNLKRKFYFLLHKKKSITHPMTQFMDVANIRL